MVKSGKRKRAVLEPIARGQVSRGGATSKSEAPKQTKSTTPIVIPSKVQTTIAGFLAGPSQTTDIPPSSLNVVLCCMKEVLRRASAPDLPLSLLSYSAEFIRDRKTFNIFSSTNKELRQLMLSKTNIPWPRVNLFKGQSLNTRIYDHMYEIHLADDAQWLCRFHGQPPATSRQNAEEQDQNNNEDGMAPPEQSCQFVFQRWNVQNGEVVAESLRTVVCDGMDMTETWSMAVAWTLDSATFRIYPLRRPNDNDGSPSTEVHFDPNRYYDIQSDILRVAITLKVEFHKSEQSATALHVDRNFESCFLANYNLQTRQLIKRSTDERLRPRFSDFRSEFALVSTDQYSLWETFDDTIELWKHDPDDNRIYDLGVDTTDFECEIFVPNPVDPFKIAIIGYLSEEFGVSIWNSLSILHLHDDFATIVPGATSTQFAEWIVDPVNIREISSKNIILLPERRPLFEWFPDGKHAYFTDPKAFCKVHLLRFELQQEGGGFKHVEESEISDPYYLHFVQVVNSIFEKEKNFVGSAIQSIQLQSNGTIVMVISTSGKVYIERL